MDKLLRLMAGSTGQLHEAQLSLLEASDGPMAEPSTRTPPEAVEQDSAAADGSPTVEGNTPHDDSREGESRTRTPEAIPRARLGTKRLPEEPNRLDDTRRRSNALEKHYKTRDVAELLSVHEETVLRLAQCGNLHSVRVGSERRYPESAIVEFLERNVDDTARRVSVPPRRARTTRRRTNKAAP